MKTLLAAALLGVAALAPRAGAQATCTVPAAPGTCTTSTGATLTIPKVVQLTLAGAASVIPTPADTDYTNGYVTFTGQTVTLRSNASVVVTVAAGTAAWTATNTAAGVTARATKPSTDLQIGSSTTGPFTPLTTTAYTLTTTSGATTGTSLAVVYRALLSWTLDTPGQYGLDVVYTITAP